jgi:hypothetical protein
MTTIRQTPRVPAPSTVVSYLNELNSIRAFQADKKYLKYNEPKLNRYPSTYRLLRINGFDHITVKTLMPSGDSNQLIPRFFTYVFPPAGPPRLTGLLPNKLKAWLLLPQQVKTHLQQFSQYLTDSNQHPPTLPLPDKANNSFDDELQLLRGAGIFKNGRAPAIGLMDETALKPTGDSIQLMHKAFGSETIIGEFIFTKNNKRYYFDQNNQFIGVVDAKTGNPLVSEKPTAQTLEAMIRSMIGQVNAYDYRVLHG